ncbi:allophanate hydrolase [Tenacibaculum holothuriorum]|uniref:Allophanate hydrolase n=1 Tax=Tenacibaculum holothuriorum TaxID=1635173 RepID=A0A1Y2P954_9FLAO|nr:5-oxoprolinase subunit PxpB [Tenacibaculum holothuriorum]OSY86975.1 allophanate hydrolase [Tenacibaculum holothuriorum]
MLKIPTYKLFGERTVLIEWEAVMSETIIQDITRFEQLVQMKKSEVIEDSVIGYHSLLLIYKEVPKEEEIESLQELYENNKASIKVESTLWEVPVCYDAQLGVDLEELAQGLQLSPQEIIQKHSNAVYGVYFIGFLPGFLYLGGLEKCLHFPRKATPRLQVPKGSVAIGGSQTGIYPQQSAGGWNIIGSTPISLFNVNKKTPCFAKSGDKIQFVPINLSAYKKIISQKDNYEPIKKVRYD